MAATRARRTSSRAPLKGRAVVAIGLGVFLLVTAAAAWRRVSGDTTARAIQKLRVEQRALRAEQQNLENDLRRATNRRAVVEQAERRLGMHVATEAQIRLLVAAPPEVMTDSQPELRP